MKKLLNPFAYVDEVKLLIIGVLAHFLFTYVGYLSHSHFPDFLSIKKTGEQIDFSTLLFQNSRNNIIAIIIFYIFGYLINKKTRIIDIANVVLVARIPYYIVFISDFIPIVNDKLNLVVEGVQQNDLSILNDISVITVVLIFSMFVILFLILMFYYLFVGFKTVTNAKGLLYVIYFILSIIIIEILTTLLTLFIYKL